MSNPYADLNEAREQAKHHAAEARRWAEAADREAVATEESAATPANVGAGPRARRFAAVSQAHSLAALATAIGGDGIVSIEDLGR